MASTDKLLQILKKDLNDTKRKNELYLRQELETLDNNRRYFGNLKMSSQILLVLVILLVIIMLSMNITFLKQPLVVVSLVYVIIPAVLLWTFYVVYNRRDEIITHSNNDITDLNTRHGYDLSDLEFDLPQYKDEEEKKVTPTSGLQQEENITMENLYNSANYNEETMNAEKSLDNLNEYARRVENATNKLNKDIDLGRKYANILVVTFKEKLGDTAAAATNFNSSNYKFLSDKGDTTTDINHNRKKRQEYENIMNDIVSKTLPKTVVQKLDNTCKNKTLSDLICSSADGNGKQWNYEAYGEKSFLGDEMRHIKHSLFNIGSIGKDDSKETYDEKSESILSSIQIANEPTQQSTDSIISKVDSAVGGSNDDYKYKFSKFIKKHNLDPVLDQIKKFIIGRINESKRQLSNIDANVDNVNQFVLAGGVIQERFDLANQPIESNTILDKRANEFANLALV